MEASSAAAARGSGEAGRFVGLAPDASDELYIARHDCHATGVRGRKLDVLHHVSAAAIQLQ